MADLVNASAPVRSRDVAEVLIARHPELRNNPVKVNALLYLSQSWSLAIQGQPLFQEDVIAAADGPLVAGVFYRRIRMAGRRSELRLRSYAGRLANASAPRRTGSQPDGTDRA